MGLCLSMLADTAAAEDAAQETFLKAYASLKEFRGDAAFSTWLFRIAANKCLDFKRKSARARTTSLDFLLEEHGDSIQRLLASPGPERSTEDAQLVEEILSCLPDAYRLILTLRELNGLNYQEIAQTMSCSVDSVKARLQRARREFLDRLRHFEAL
jgi:RNA polymerase sigma-70 factor (ECF subfamily)